MPKKAAPAPPALPTQIIYCGDNLDQLAKLPDASVDLIYIDPPFNSDRNYEVFWGETKEKRAFEDRHESTKAYIEFMRPRCVELARVLKRTGSFYYHCDWHASHYVKVMLDQIFGESSFQNEVIWKRKQGRAGPIIRFGVANDSIFFYTKSQEYTFNPIYVPNDPAYIAAKFTYTEADGRRYRTDNLTSPNPRPNLTYEYKGFQPPVNGWAISRELMEKWDAEGRLHFPKKPGGRIARKRYLDELKGEELQNIWDDIPPLNSQAAERLGYPTQKPLALLERIITASSKAGDIVLDAFCGCGTALVAAEQTDRKWVGIDVSPTACRVMADRLRDVCQLREGKDFYVRDLPRGEKQLRAMPHFEFENWAVIALGGIPNKAKVGDMGIDGRIYPVSAIGEKTRKKKDDLPFMDVWYPIQVKQKDKAGRPDIDAFEAVMAREDRTKGFFVSFDFTSDAMTEIGAFFRKSGKVIIPLTVREILDEEIARKLA
jgi:DNA modification methylase